MESVTSVIKRVTWPVTAPMQKAMEVVVVEVGCHSLLVIVVSTGFTIFHDDIIYCG